MDVYRSFPFPLNVFMHILTREEGSVASLHYGFFEGADEPIGVAQDRATEMLLARLPPPPARVLDVGSGVGSTLSRLYGRGYEVVGISPDPQQVALIHSRYGGGLDVRQTTFEAMTHSETFDSILFQESAQYIPTDSLWRGAAAMTGHVVVADEFSLQPLDDSAALHSLEQFLESAVGAGFALTEEIDVSAKAAPTMEYFASRIPAFRDALVSELGVTPQQVEHLIESGARYRDRYARGIYGYRLLQFRAQGAVLRA